MINRYTCNENTIIWPAIDEKSISTKSVITIMKQQAVTLAEFVFCV